MYQLFNVGHLLTGGCGRSPDHSSNHCCGTGLFVPHLSQMCSGPLLDRPPDHLSRAGSKELLTYGLLEIEPHEAGQQNQKEQTQGASSQKPAE